MTIRKAGVFLILRHFVIQPMVDVWKLSLYKLHVYHGINLMNGNNTSTLAMITSEGAYPDLLPRYFPGQSYVLA